MGCMIALKSWKQVQLSRSVSSEAFVWNSIALLDID